MLSSMGGEACPKSEQIGMHRVKSQKIFEFLMEGQAYVLCTAGGTGGGR